ncbi:hypothetical protein AR505_0869 [methanogenic archaeon ISO4-H5]|nr:hypothetical protein AR505_0869 [methanogenic archaeon ISO4-H5]
MARISLYDEEEPPKVEYVFGGRLHSSEYVKITDEKNREVDVHKVHIDLVLTNEQYRELLSFIGKDEPIRVLLV